MSILFCAPESSREIDTTLSSWAIGEIMMCVVMQRAEPGQAEPGQVLGQAFLYCIPMYTHFRSLVTKSNRATNFFLIRKIIETS